MKQADFGQLGTEEKWVSTIQTPKICNPAIAPSYHPDNAAGWVEARLILPLHHPTIPLVLLGGWRRGSYPLFVFGNSLVFPCRSEPLYSQHHQSLTRLGLVETGGGETAA